MSKTVQRTGNYEIFKTDHNNQILVLDDEDYFAWVEGQRGELLARSDSDHKKEKTLSKGQFIMIDYHDEPDFRDQPHLFLQEGDSYRELLLPHGLPAHNGDKEKLIETNHKLARSEILS